MNLPYRPGVGIILLNKDNLVFVAKRIGNHEKVWQMPQGGIDKGEEPYEAALREMKEEIGTNKATLIKESSRWYKYDLPEYLIGKVWKGKYRGQTQKWFLFRFTGSDSDINIHTKHPEFDDWHWTAFSELVDLAVSFKRGLYEAVVDEFGVVVENLGTKSPPFGKGG